jgi:septation ring formation regulator EzrA
MNSIETKLNIVNSGISIVNSRISDLADDYKDINRYFQNMQRDYQDMKRDYQDMKRDYQDMYQVVFQALDNITNARQEYGKKKLKEIEIKREVLRIKRENRKQKKIIYDSGGYTINTTPKL